MIEAVQPCYHRDQAPPPLLCGSGKAITRFLGMPGLQPVGSGDTAQYRVAVRLFDVGSAHGLAPGERTGGVKFTIQPGRFLNGSLRQCGKIARRHIGTAFVRPAIAGAEMTVVETQTFRLLVHQVGERLLGARNALGQHDAGVIARKGHNAMEQIFHRHLLARGKEHGRSGGGAMPFRPCFGTYGEFLTQFELPLLDETKGDVHRHHLRHRSRRYPPVGILVIQHGAR